MRGPVWSRDDGRYSLRLYEYRDDRPGRAPRLVLYRRWHTPGAPPPGRQAFGTDRGVAEHDAADEWAEYERGELSAPDPPPLTVGALVDAYCARTTRRDDGPLRESTRGAYRTHLAHWRTECGDDLALSRVTRTHVDRAVARVTADSSQSTVLHAIRGCLRWGAERWPDIVRDVTGRAHVHVERRMRPWLRREEVAAFLAACRPAHRIRAGLLIETGLRVTEALSLRWEWIVTPPVGLAVLSVPRRDPASGFETKGLSARAVPLSAAARAILDAARERWGSTGYVLHDGTDVPSRSFWWRESDRACQAARLRHVDVHGLRRTAGALWLLAGVDIYTVSRWLGHASVSTTERHYVDLHAAGHLAAIRLVDAAAAVPSLARDAARGEDDQRKPGL